MSEARIQFELALDTGRRRIYNWSSLQLDAAIDHAVETIPDFWTIMRGVDAYMERRRRKEQ
jgi:hypothetical protein